MTLTKKLGAEFIGTSWLVLGGCGSAVLAGIVYKWFEMEEKI